MEFGPRSEFEILYGLSNSLAKEARWSGSFFSMYLNHSMYVDARLDLSNHRWRPRARDWLDFPSTDNRP